MLRLLAGDPAESPDAFGFCGSEVDLNSGLMYIRYARQWTDTSFSQVAREIKPVWKSISPKIFALEKNNRGGEAIRKFREIGLPVMGVTTVNRLTNRNKWAVMDKTYTVDWVGERLKDHMIKFPADYSIYMEMLLEQIRLITRYSTPNGSKTYRARNNRHDDLFMGFLINCHLARLTMEAAQDA